MTLQAYGAEGEAGVTAAEAEIRRLDALLSVSSQEGDIYQLNHQRKGEVTQDTILLLKKAAEVSAETEGLFDCTIAPVMELWGFRSGDFHVPQDAALTEALSKMDVSGIRLSGNTVTLDPDVSVDLGGIAKGYTSQRIMEVYQEQGVTSGIVSLGGNVQALGTKPDGSFWRVALQDPEKPEEYFGILEVADAAVITSGGYQRNFTENGKRYHHIIDPRTGYPAENGLISVTIVSKDGTLADALSTSLFIMGPEESTAFWQDHKDAFEAILVTDDRKILITEGLQNEYKPLSDDPVFVIQS